MMKQSRKRIYTLIDLLGGVERREWEDGGLTIVACVERSASIYMEKEWKKGQIMGLLPRVWCGANLAFMGRIQSWLICLIVAFRLVRI